MSAPDMCRCSSWCCSSWLCLQGPLQTVFVLVKETDLMTSSCRPESGLWGRRDEDGWFCKPRTVRLGGVCRAGPGAILHCCPHPLPADGAGDAGPCQ